MPKRYVWPPVSRLHEGVAMVGIGTGATIRLLLPSAVIARCKHEDAEALLFGAAGFLDAPDLDAQLMFLRPP
jgi:hypothetical protein